MPHHYLVGDLAVLNIDGGNPNRYLPILLEHGIMGFSTSEGTHIICSRKQVTVLQHLISMNERLQKVPGFLAIADPQNHPWPNHIRYHEGEDAYDFLLSAYMGVNSHRLNDTHYHVQFENAFKEFRRTRPEAALPLELIFRVLATDRAQLLTHFEHVFQEVNDLTHGWKERNSLPPDLLHQVLEIYQPLSDAICMRAQELNAAQRIEPYLHIIGHSQARELGYDTGLRQGMPIDRVAVGGNIRFRLPGRVDAECLLHVADEDILTGIRDLYARGDLQITGPAKMQNDDDLKQAYRNATILNTALHCGDDVATGAILSKLKPLSHGKQRG